MADRLTTEQEAALRMGARADAADPDNGTWSRRRSQDVKGAFDIIVTYQKGEQLCAGHILHSDDCDRIISARNAVPALLAELTAVRAEKAALIEAIESIRRAHEKPHGGYENILPDVMEAAGPAFALAKEMKGNG
ncbi:MAG TPA: hypothetical protein VK540_35625 [Polyangiaceae bacterium]|nr:hypothetical protein [Polyangiaceae bacterium]